MLTIEQRETLADILHKSLQQSLLLKLPFLARLVKFLTSQPRFCFETVGGSFDILAIGRTELIGGKVAIHFL